jgi:hypothetical protein
MTNKHIAAVVNTQKKNAVLAIRQQFKGKDLVNVRECLTGEDNDFTPTQAGFTIPAEKFADFLKALKKFGRAAGLIGKNGDEDFKIKDFDDLDGNEDEIGIVGKAKGGKEKAEGKTGIKRKAKDLEAIAKAKRPTDDDKPAKAKKAKDEDDDADDAPKFNMKAFKKAIKAAVKADDTATAKEVIALYKGNRKMLKDKLPKHAVNALEKSLSSKKDEALMKKAVVACEKHIVEKDFSL